MEALISWYGGQGVGIYATESVCVYLVCISQSGCCGGSFLIKCLMWRFSYQEELNI